MLNLIFYFFMTLSTFSFSEVRETFSNKIEIETEISELLKELPKEKAKKILSVKKDIMTNEINFRNRFVELRSSANRALKEKNEKKYRSLMVEIGILKNERNLLRTYYFREIEDIIGVEFPEFYENNYSVEYFNFI